VTPFEKLSEVPLFKSAPAAEAGASGAGGEGSDPAEEEAVDAPPPVAELDWAALPGLLGRLREKLDALGPVNHEAIAEFEEVQDRDRFLEEQCNDLLGSKKELLEIIAQLNKTTEAMFSETFAAIRENFREMFSMLFGGGQADLQLMDSSDPLECGIDIIARPPGKKLSTVSLLSGGERTMTAVSLLFSIYMVKPSPFCILDEMDAPLDESNIARFLKILDRFVGQSQFIVITHNKRTIARADVLYGVTMQERGVSRLVGVRLSEAETAPAGSGAAAGEEGQKPADELALS
jgi:chromosome segregation protein